MYHSGSNIGVFLISFLVACIHPPFVWEQYWKHPMPYSFWKKSSLEIMLLLDFYTWCMSNVLSLSWNKISCHSYCVGKWFSHNSTEASEVTAATELMNFVVELFYSTPSAFSWSLQSCNLHFLFVCTVPQGWDGWVWLCLTEVQDQICATAAQKRRRGRRRTTTNERKGKCT